MDMVDVVAISRVGDGHGSCFVAIVAGMRWVCLFRIAMAQVSDEHGTCRIVSVSRVCDGSDGVGNHTSLLHPRPVAFGLNHV